MPSRKTATTPSRAENKPVTEDVAPAVHGARLQPAAPRRGAAKREELQNVTADVQRRHDREDDDVPTPPSSLDLDRHASAARSGSQQLNERRRKRNDLGADITGGDADADGMSGYFVGDEASSGDNPTPGQVDVEEVGRAVGEEYQDNEELRFTDKVAKRDRHRWELDPASSEDYKERIETTKKRKRP